MPIIDGGLIQFETKTFEYSLLGDGDKTVIFLNGFRMPINSWVNIYPVIARTYRVMLFNRLSVGKSSKAQRPQDGGQVVADLCQLLLELQLKPPYILVAHSLGGIFANLFARTYPLWVSAVIFVDSAHPQEIVQQRSYRAPVILRLVNNGVKFLEKLADPYKFSEDEAIGKTIAQVDVAGDFPAIPTAVVSGTQKLPLVPEQAFQLHQKYQQELLTLSPLSKHYCCHNSGHFPQITEPESVIAAIVTTIEAIDRGS